MPERECNSVNNVGLQRVEGVNDPHLHTQEGFSSCLCFCLFRQIVEIGSKIRIDRSFLIAPVDVIVTVVSRKQSRVFDYWLSTERSCMSLVVLL